MTNFGLTSVIHTAQTAAHNQHLPVAERQSQPPAYNTLAATNEYESTTNVQGEKEWAMATRTNESASAYACSYVMRDMLQK